MTLKEQFRSTLEVTGTDNDQSYIEWLEGGLQNLQSIETAVKDGYPLMGFSIWHHEVARHLGGYPPARGYNAVLTYGGESIVIKGDPFRIDDKYEYHHPHTISFERSRRFPDGHKIKLPEYTRPYQICSLIRQCIESHSPNIVAWSESS